MQNKKNFGLLVFIKETEKWRLIKVKQGLTFWEPTLVLHFAYSWVLLNKGCSFPSRIHGLQFWIHVWPWHSSLSSLFSPVVWYPFLFPTLSSLEKSLLRRAGYSLLFSHTTTGTLFNKYFSILTNIYSVPLSTEGASLIKTMCSPMEIII